MAQREFANQKALVAYAEQNDLAYEYEYTPAFATWLPAYVGSGSKARITAPQH
jgi:hypothetical protein